MHSTDNVFGGVGAQKSAKPQTKFRDVCISIDYLILLQV